MKTSDGYDNRDKTSFIVHNWSKLSEELKDKIANYDRHCLQCCTDSDIRLTPP